MNNTIYIECNKSNLINLLNNKLNNISYDNKKYTITYISDKKAYVTFDCEKTYNTILDQNRALYKLFNLDWINDKDEEEELIIKSNF